MENVVENAEKKINEIIPKEVFKELPIGQKLLKMGINQLLMNKCEKDLSVNQ